MLAAKLFATPILIATEFVVAGELCHLRAAFEMTRECRFHLHNCLLDNCLLNTWEWLLDYDPCGLRMELYLTGCHHLGLLLHWLVRWLTL